MKKNPVKWTAAAAIRRPDSIVSSKARENNEAGFVPSYEKERKESMNFIMSNEYQRMWLKERGYYELDTYTKLEVEAGGSDIKRRYVQRYMKSRKQGKVLPIITLKRFANVPAKTDTKKLPAEQT